MAYKDFKDFPRRTALDKVLRGKAFDIEKNLKHDGYQRGIASMVYKFFDETSKDSGTKMKLNKMNKKLKNCKNQLSENLKKERIFII